MVLSALLRALGSRAAPPMIPDVVGEFLAVHRNCLSGLRNLSLAKGCPESELDAPERTSPHGPGRQIREENVSFCSSESWDRRGVEKVVCW